MRISDWSSDVCSSDLDRARQAGQPRTQLFVGYRSDPAVRPRDVAAPGARGTGRGGSADRAARARPAPDARRRRLCVARRPAAAAVARSDADRAADRGGVELLRIAGRSEQHKSDLQSIMRIQDAVLHLKKQTINTS